MFEGPCTKRVFRRWADNAISKKIRTCIAHPIIILINWQSIGYTRTMAFSHINASFVRDHPMTIHAQFEFNHVCSF
jgi:hypothetical protein